MFTPSTSLHSLPLCRTARGAKFQRLVETVHKPGLEFVQIDDVATGDFTEALKGVDVVLHMACPLAGRKGLDETFQVRVRLTKPFVPDPSPILHCVFRPQLTVLSMWFAKRRKLESRKSSLPVHLGRSSVVRTDFFDIIYVTNSSLFSILRQGVRWICIV